jgi:DNA-binding transcriptional LysR family regulator
VNAFVDLIKEFGGDEYDFSIRETQTHEIIEDVARMKSELGILYLNDFNEPVLSKEIKSKELKFTELFSAKPHVFVGSANPLAQKKSVTLDDLLPYPYLSFEQGEYNSFYYSEEILSTIKRPKNIRVRDRATLFNLLIGLNGYTICSGVIDEKLNGSDIVAVPLEAEGSMRIGIVTHKKVLSNPLTEFYINALKKYIGEETRLTT